MSHAKLSALLAVLALLAGACSQAPPPLPEELSRAETLPVKKKRFLLFSGERVSFGEWIVDRVRRDSNQNVMRPVASRIAVELQESYTFRMTRTLADGGREAWRGECRSDARRQDYLPLLGSARERGYQVALKCDLRNPDTEQVWRLDLLEDDTSGRVLQGSLSDGSESLWVTGHRDTRGGNREASHSGFDFSSEGRPLGAVIMAQDDRILVHPDADQVRPGLEAASAALLLYLDSNRRMKDLVQARLESEREHLL